MNIDRPLVLVVEDEIFLRMILVAQLLDAGFDTVECGNASDAEFMLASYPEVDVVIADDVLLDELDSRRFAERVVTQWPDKKVVLTTHKPGNGLIEGEDIRYLRKPFKIDELTSLILEMLVAPAVRARRTGRL
ncbi:response regulator [Rhizobium jaguaris]|uniref:Response regulator n=1 Tax=Rhizobium jaguaris TaxID=1312183 RepID=A0A387FWT2_9HYPH|nr:response regulator [Rhizobium jaguaris]AYG59992.1 response regulator [Rhizobium jaguaris]